MVFLPFFLKVLHSLPFADAVTKRGPAEHVAPKVAVAIYQDKIAAAYRERYREQTILWLLELKMSFPTLL